MPELCRSSINVQHGHSMPGCPTQLSHRINAMSCHGMIKAQTLGLSCIASALRCPRTLRVNATYLSPLTGSVSVAAFPHCCCVSPYPTSIASFCAIWVSGVSMRVAYSLWLVMFQALPSAVAFAWTLESAFDHAADYHYCIVRRWWCNVQYAMGSTSGIDMQVAAHHNTIAWSRRVCLGLCRRITLNDSWWHRRWRSIRYTRRQRTGSSA